MRKPAITHLRSCCGRSRESALRWIANQLPSPQENSRHIDIAVCVSKVFQQAAAATQSTGAKDQNVHPVSKQWCERLFTQNLAWTLGSNVGLETLEEIASSLGSQDSDDTVHWV